MTAKRRQRAPLKVVGLLVGEVVTFDLAIPDQIFGRTDGYRWSICGLKRGWVPTETGLAVRVERGLDALDEADTIVVPGITENAWPVPERALTKLRDAHDSGIRIASVCTGAFVLAAAGLLDGKRATTHWRYASLLARMFPAVEVDPGVLYVDEGTVCTSAGLAAGIDMCLHLVADDFGAALAQKVARNTVVAPHRAGGQAQFIEPPTARGTASATGLGPVIAHMSASFADPLTVDELAQRAAMSPRSFVRHFRAQTGTTPHQWLVHRRLEAARTLLETTDLAVNDVALRCGFGSALVLRQHFARHLDTTPTAYRRTFATP